MIEAIEDLVLAPFRDIVVKGNLAAKNADDGGNDEMPKAAQSLVKEGERALKKIEPLCLKKVEEYGISFVDAVKDENEISRFVEDLNNLLYDFEDYVEAESFRADKFAELQALSRKAILRISHIVTRMKISPAQDQQTPQPDIEPVSSASSPVTARNTPMISSRPSSATASQIRLGSRDQQLLLPYPDDEEPDEQVKFAGRPTSVDINELSPPLPPTPPPPPPPPPPPFLNPWFPYASSSLTHQMPTNASSRSSAASLSSQPARASVSSSANLSVRSSVNHHQHHAPQQQQQQSCDSSSSHYYLDTTSPVSPTTHIWGRNTGGPSPFDFVHDHSPHVPPLFSRGGEGDDGIEPTGSEPVVLPPPDGIIDGLMPVEEEGEQPKDEIVEMGPEMQLGGCAMSLNCSFYQLKGFCPGATEIVLGGLGIRHIRKQGLSRGNIEVAKCKSCSYELEWKAVEKDVNNEASENFESAGIGFRLRFLSKSHLPTKNVGEQVYGCIFCVRERHTNHPNDATVFFTQKQLFAHLARHAHPLPSIPGITIIEAEKGQISPLLVNNYDLHFATNYSPRSSPISDASLQALTAFPTAIAATTCRQTLLFPLRRPADGAEVVPFAAGARIIGVVFPDKYQGEWCLGWADHMYGIIPADAIRLVPPQRSSSRSQGSSAMRAVARWKFSGKEQQQPDRGEVEWLSFGKGEVITNISCDLSIYSVGALLHSSPTSRDAEKLSVSQQDHWCWWGTNAKGKSGLFPRSHLQPGTLMEASPTSLGRGTDYNGEKRHSLLSRMSIRHRFSGSGEAGAAGPRVSLP